MTDEAVNNIKNNSNYQYINSKKNITNDINIFNNNENKYVIIDFINNNWISRPFVMIHFDFENDNYSDDKILENIYHQNKTGNIEYIVRAMLYSPIMLLKNSEFIKMTDKLYNIRNIYKQTKIILQIKKNTSIRINFNLYDNNNIDYIIYTTSKLTEKQYKLLNIDKSPTEPVTTSTKGQVTTSTEGQVTTSTEGQVTTSTRVKATSTKEPVAKSLENSSIEDNNITDNDINYKELFPSSSNLVDQWKNDYNISDCDKDFKNSWDMYNHIYKIWNTNDIENNIKNDIKDNIENNKLFKIYDISKNNYTTSSVNYNSDLSSNYYNSDLSNNYYTTSSVNYNSDLSSNYYNSDSSNNYYTTSSVNYNSDLSSNYYNSDLSNNYYTTSSVNYNSDLSSNYYNSDSSNNYYTKFSKLQFRFVK